jgi:CheY-like chemotaxis protein
MNVGVGSRTRRARVLVVSDRDEVVEKWCMALDGAYDVLAAPDGERALGVAAELRPSAVAIDLALPRIDALDLADALRGHPRTCDAVIVAVADDARTDAIQLARARGCDAVLALRVCADTIVQTLDLAVTKRAA